MSFLSYWLTMIPSKISLPSSLLQQSHINNEDYDFGMRGGRHAKPCRACTDFKTWIKTGKPPDNKSNNSTEIESYDQRKRSDCPVDKDELGRNSWSLLHTMSVYYPEKPTNEEQELMKNFIKGLARFYPCETCAKDFQHDIQNDPPELESRKSLTKWWCRMHNRVNKKLGKPEFDCNKIDQRWLDGWSDGSCD